MTNEEKKEWLSLKYPLTVIQDRYVGVYSGARWLAFPLDYTDVPEDANGDDTICAQFWHDYKEPVGKGGCAEEAIDNLLMEMEASTPKESEDERIRKALVEIFSGCIKDNEFCHTGFTYAEITDWLEKQKDLDKMIVVTPEVWDNAINEAFENGKKEGEKQKEQKSAECGEEDERVIRDACCWIAEYAGFLMSENKDKAEMLWKLSEKLKSLRPSWKPSEEQMAMLLAVIRDPNNAGSESCHLALESLLEDLNKLF